MSTTTLILIYLVAAFLGSRVPVVRVYLAHVHNLVYLVISVCLEGVRKNKIKLYQDGFGETTGNLTSSFKKALISYAGYTGASLAAIGLFYLVTRGYYHLAIYLVLGICVLALVLWIRNAYGVIWGISLVVLLALPVYFRTDMVLAHLSILLASVLFSQSIVGAIQVCRQSLMTRGNPGRKAALVQTKFVPAVVLGMVLFGQTLYVGYYFVRNF
ncbi:M50 family metallopeptidase [Neobacillus cucumis]|uniref:M50 family metallopeptidase n=1 Tax=Neobacillus cucumis TaxID=1740721 RepID=UPI0028534CD1|nr:M50 family metallopeptidase [Neobacillus cucumis]MDR4949665.1 M50 family metallopeptidase [Neobacillus cucumis]